MKRHRPVWSTRSDCPLQVRCWRCCGATVLRLSGCPLCPDQRKIVVCWLSVDFNELPTWTECWPVHRTESGAEGCELCKRNSAYRCRWHLSSATFHCSSGQVESVTRFAFFQWNTASRCPIERRQSADSDTWSCGCRLRRPSPIPERPLWAHPSDPATGIVRPWPGPWFRLCWWRKSVHSTCTTDWCWPGDGDVDGFVNCPIGAQSTNLPGPIRRGQPPTGPRSIRTNSVPTCPRDLHDSVEMTETQLPIYPPFHLS